MKPPRLLLLAALAGLSGLPGVGAAQSLLLTGAEVSGRGSYAYLGHIAALGDRPLGAGWVVRHWVDRVTYDYRSGAREIDAEALGYAPAVGYLSGGETLSHGLYGGVRLAHTTLSPDDPGNGSRGWRARPFVQADGVWRMRPGVEQQFVASWELGSGEYYLRDRLAVRIGEDLALGPEIVLKGGRNYDGWQFGVVLSKARIAADVGLNLKLGAAGQHGESTAAYIGLELVTILGR